MSDVSPATSSPSHYSHAPSNIGHASSRLRALAEAEANDQAEAFVRISREAVEDDARTGLMSGPRLRKYAEIPWDDEEWSIPGSGREVAASGGSGFGRHATRIMRMRSREVSPSGSMVDSASTATGGSTSTRRGLAHILGVGKHLLPSASGISLASTQTASTASLDDRPHPITPNLKEAFDGASSSPPFPTQFEDDTPRYAKGSMEKMRLEPSAMRYAMQQQADRMFDGDRPLLSSGSPGFGLISLEVAQERERLRSISRSKVQQGGAPPRVELLGGRSEVLPKAHARYHTEPIPLEQQRTPLAESHIPHIPHIPACPPPPIPIDVPIPTPSRTTASAPSSPPVPHRVKGKKSGLMKLFNKASSSSSNHNQPTPAVPRKESRSMDQTHPPRSTLERESSQASKHTASSRSASIWSDADTLWSSRGPGKECLAATGIRPQLELRPVSMTFTHGLPSDYLTEKDTASPEADPVAVVAPEPLDEQGQPSDLAEMFKEQITNARKAWRVQLFELEAQIRELRDELEGTRQVGHGACHTCGCTCSGTERRRGKDEGTGGVMDRARVKTAGARGVFGSGSLYEWE